MIFGVTKTKSPRTGPGKTQHVSQDSVFLTLTAPLLDCSFTGPPILTGVLEINNVKTSTILDATRNGVQWMKCEHTKNIFCAVFATSFAHFWTQLFLVQIPSLDDYCSIFSLRMKQEWSKNTSRNLPLVAWWYLRTAYYVEFGFPSHLWILLCISWQSPWVTFIFLWLLVHCAGRLATAGSKCYISTRIRLLVQETKSS